MVNFLAHVQRIFGAYLKFVNATDPLFKRKYYLITKTTKVTKGW